MEVFEITGYATGVSREGVNYLEPGDSFQKIENGFIYRQVLQSRQGIGFFCPRLTNETRIYGIFEHILTDGTTQLLAFDSDNLYKYTAGTFVQIPFGGSMAAYGGFGLTDKDAYISGISYPFADGSDRFVFTGSRIQTNANGSALFFYDGTNVLDFTSVVDNPDYVAPSISGLTKIVRAKYVTFFGGRLNLISPTLSSPSTLFTDGVLYSGIRNLDGNGDNFNIAGSGLRTASTNEAINGFSILGQVMILNFYRSNWAIELTRDVFNPYFFRKIPSVLGTNADFSSVSWNDTVKSVGKTGVIGTDNRQSLRVDNKIPFFTQDEIDQVDFNLTYGGFNRQNNQFLWSFKESEADTDTQNKVLVNNYEENTWSVYDLRLSVFGQTEVGENLTWNQIDETAGNPAWAKWSTTTDIWNKIGLGQSVEKTLAGDDLGFIYEFTTDFDDYHSEITGIAAGATTTITIEASGFQAGDLVIIQDVVGTIADEINSDEPWTVISATPTTITVNAVTTGTWTSGGYAAKPIAFKAETIPFNPYRSQGRRCFVSHIEFLIDNNGGSLRVDVKADEEPNAYIQDVLIEPDPAIVKDRQWITMTVDNEANFHTFVLKHLSASSQVKITSMRIHAAPGGMTSG